MSPRIERPWLILGRPDGKRVQGIQDACARQGRPPARVLSWSDWLTSPDRLTQYLPERGVLKIEPPGEDAQVHHRLRQWGASHLGCSPPRLLEHGELGSDALWFQGFTAAMQALSSQLKLKPDVVVVNKPEDVLAMTDKWQCQERLHQSGLGTPDRLGSVGLL